MQEEFSLDNPSSEQQDKILGSPQKRRGRPEKKPQPFFEEGDQLFTLHDNVFHAAILFYTFRVFNNAPTRNKFNPTIGFSVYEKVKNFAPQLKKYYDNDEIAQKEAAPYENNFHLKRFFINSMTFGPKCVIDEFYLLFHFILNKLSSHGEVTPELCMDYIKQGKLKYLNFDNSVLEFLQAKTPSIRQALKKVIDTELRKLLEIIIHILQCLLSENRQNKFSNILQTEDDMFERGVNSKTNKKVKKE